MRKGVIRLNKQQLVVAQWVESVYATTTPDGSFLHFKMFRSSEVYSYRVAVPTKWVNEILDALQFWLAELAPEHEEISTVFDVQAGVQALEEDVQH